MKQRNQLNVKLKINVSVTRAKGDQTHAEVVGFELSVEE